MNALFEGIAIVVLLVFGVEVAIFMAAGNSLALLAEFNAGMMSAASELAAFLNPFSGGGGVTASALAILIILAWMTCMVWSFLADGLEQRAQ